MIRKIAAILAGLVLALGMTAVAAQPAAASSAQCSSSGWLCMWFDDGYGGQFSTFNTTPNTCVNLNGTWNDQMSSFWNRTGWHVFMYKNAGCSSGFPFYEELIAAPGTASPGVGSGWNDKVTSYRLGNCSC